MLTIGYILNGRYKLKSLIGSGGTAHVYLAEDLFLKRDVSVKVLRYDFADDERALKRFHREARAISEVNHEHIVQLFDVDSEGPYHYIVMEYVDGMDLKKYLRLNYPLSLLQVIEMMKQIVQAVSYAHRRGLIHRDLKPQNILIDRSGDLKITDFGIATGLNEASMTQTNTLVGSIHYLSPEQTRGHSATNQSDIYALGIIFYELIMGNVPFTGDSAVSIAMKHFQEALPSVKKYAKQDIPQSVENIILKACAKQPDNRYSSAQEMFVALERCMDAKVMNEPKYNEPTPLDMTKEMVRPIQQANSTAATPTPPTETRKKKKWLRIWLGALGLLLVGSIVAAFFILLHKDEVSIPDLSNQPQAQATKTLSELGLNISQVEYQEHDTIKKDSVISTSPSAAQKVAQGTAVKLVVSSGKTAKTMKNYVSKTYTQAYDELIADGFIVERVEEMSLTIPQGSVVSQSIPSGTKITTENTVVRLTVSTGATSVSDYRGQPYEKVVSQLKEIGFSIVVTESINYSVSAGEIISQSVAPGSKVDPKTTTIELVVAKQIDFVNQPLSAVQSQLAGVNIPVEIKEEASQTHEKNVVMKQEIVRNGNAVTLKLTVSTGPQLTMPNLVGSTRTFAQSHLQNLGVKVSYVTKTSTTYPVGTVIDQSVRAGEVLQKGQIVTITVSTGQ
ncbi:Stk1 family PASTA domain-containing Ser/Thr kinase [Carnobacteriaceae bacterium zg-ZUI252]|nr:Stk1 family PASTA domain-containing Ser/Thr kinase [Carnobacteriaceae bacterium zg-ZUI252]QTU83370.1 Stk1 family PASTA domain-containing Ser/Thr kinase [Carnobacteriaceae bacterium zg-C25]